MQGDRRSSICFSGYRDARATMQDIAADRVGVRAQMCKIADPFR
jgi:hypothetical protein